MEKEETVIEISSQQEQIHSLLFSKEIGWQEIITDLINTEELDPWDVNIIHLTEKYLERLNQYEEENYHVSSKVLLAAALLLRIKSELLLNKYIRSIDEILFGKKEQEEKKEEIIEFDDDVPELLPRSPIPRMKKVTLNDLMESLNKAIITENRRIKKEVAKSNVIRDAEMLLPKKRYIITNKIKEIYEKIFDLLKQENNERLGFSKIPSKDSEEKVANFVALLHLENQRKINISQEKHFGEIYIGLGSKQQNS